MKNIIIAAILASGCMAVANTASATVLTFEDLYTGNDVACQNTHYVQDSILTADYGDLIWSTGYQELPIDYDRDWEQGLCVANKNFDPYSGFNNDSIFGNYSAFDTSSNGINFKAKSNKTFDFNSAWFTFWGPVSEWREGNYEIDVVATDINNNVLHLSRVSLSETKPVQQFKFNWIGVHQVSVTTGNWGLFMDNLTINEPIAKDVPIPSTFALFTIAAFFLLRNRNRK